MYTVSGANRPIAIAEARMLLCGQVSATQQPIYNRRVSQMRALLADCHELAVDYNTLPKALYVFEHIT